MFDQFRQLKDKGYSDSEIAKRLGISALELRALVASHKDKENFTMSETGDKVKKAAEAKAQVTEARKEAAAAVKTAKKAAGNGKGAVEAIADVATSEASHVDAKKVSKGLGNTGQGFLALAVATYGAAVAYAKFKAAYKGQYRS